MRTVRYSLIAALTLILAACMVVTPAYAQRPTQFAGSYWAKNFAYGVNQTVAGFSVGIGTTATGAGTVTLNFGNLITVDALGYMPFSTNAPITIGAGSNAETVTPTAVSCNTPLIYQTCAITATYSNTHGVGDPVITGTAGLQEAINYARAQGGGFIEIDAAWFQMGGTTTLITAAAGYSNVALHDNRSGVQAYWSLQPSTLTSLAAPATLTGTTAVFSAAPVGTWTNAAQFLCVTYVDALGGEGPCSATFNATPSANTTLTITAPAASTGAVGWRAYGGATYNGAFLLPIAAANCTLTTLESVIPACAMGSNGVFTTIFVNTTTLRPQAQTPVVNLQTPFPQGHTTFAYAPTGSLPSPFQTHYGPFPAFGSLSAGQVGVLGSVNLPAGYLNVIGRTVRLRGKVTLGSTNTATLPTLNVALGWVAGTTAGAPVNLCAFEGVAVGATKVYNGEFECRLTTNASGATAIGTIQPAGFLMLQAQDISANGLGPYIDTNVAVVGSLGLQAQDTVYVTYTSTTNSTAAPQLLDLHVETLE